MIVKLFGRKAIIDFRTLPSSNALRMQNIHLTTLENVFVGTGVIGLKAHYSPEMLLLCF
jgi:hypothetical protein